MASDSYVQWRELEKDFKKLFPLTVKWVMDNETPAPVRYVGVEFEIHPVYTPMLSEFMQRKFFPDGGEILLAVEDITVWGPPHVNLFPDPYYVSMRVSL